MRVSDASTQAGDASRSPKSEKKLGLVARIKLFFRQIIGEMKKVVTPTRKELGTLFVTVNVVRAHYHGFCRPAGRCLCTASIFDLRLGK